MLLTRREAMAGCAGGFALLVSPAKSQAAYPNRTIKMIVPYPPGGTSDILTRLIGAKLTASWGQQIITDNRTGAGGA